MKLAGARGRCLEGPFQRYVNNDFVGLHAMRNEGYWYYDIHVQIKLGFKFRLKNFSTVSGSCISLEIKTIINPLETISKVQEPSL